MYYPHSLTHTHTTKLTDTDLHGVEPPTKLRLWIRTSRIGTYLLGLVPKQTCHLSHCSFGRRLKHGCSLSNTFCLNLFKYA